MSRPFKRIAIVGVGLIGGSLAAAFKRKQVDLELAGVSSPRNIAAALSAGLLDRGYPREELPEALKGADLVVLCTPIDTILQLLPQVAAHAEQNAVVTDVGSTKSRIVKRAAELFGNGPFFVGGHPMAGSEKRGIEAADPFLFENATWVLTPADGVRTKQTAALSDLLREVGAQVLLMDPNLHDEIAAAVSHLPQLLAVALMNFAGRRNQENPFYLRLAAGGFRDMTRIASSPYEIWSDILKTNSKNIVNAIDGFIETLTNVRELVGADALQAEFELAARNRLSIPKDTRGFLRPHFDISVVVEDKPGVIAAISGDLAAAGINIKDIEVLKVREGEGGTLRLAFETEEDRANALQVLSRAGFEARPR